MENTTAKIAELFHTILQNKKSSATIEVDYSEESFNDEILKDIRNICIEYLHDNSIIDDFSDAEILIAQEFISVKFNEVNTLNEQFKLGVKYTPITDIYSDLDLITINGLETFSQKSAKKSLQTNLSKALETLTFCHGILNMIIDEKFKDIN